MPGGQIGENLRRVARGFGAVEVLDPHGKVAQTGRERAVVLQGEDRRGNQHGHLLAVGRSLERRTDRHLGLAEAHVAAHQTIHRLIRLHVPLDGCGRRLLVGRILPSERSLQLVLEITVRRKGEPSGSLALGIEGDQLARDVLHGLLGGALELLPCPRAELVDLGRLAVARFVARNAMERVDVDEEHVAVLIDQLDGLVRATVLRDLHQPVETPDAVVDVHHVIARTETVELRHGHLFVPPDLAVDAVALVAVENLVIGIEARLEPMVHESLVQRQRERSERRLPAPDLMEDIFEAFDLRPVLRKDESLVTAQRVADQIVGQQFEILVELGLRRRAEDDFRIGGALSEVVAEREQTAVRHIGQQAVAAGDVGVDLGRVVQIAQQFAAHVVHAPQHVIRIVAPVRRLAAGETRERDLAGLAGIEVGDDLHAIEPVGRELARYVEPTDRIHLVAEEIHAVGFALREGEDIHDAAAHGVLPGLVDEVDLREPRIDERLPQHLGGDAVADPHGDGLALQFVGVGDPLGDRLGEGADDQIIRPVRPRGTGFRRPARSASGPRRRNARLRLRRRSALRSGAPLRTRIRGCGPVRRKALSPPCIGRNGSGRRNVAFRPGIFPVKPGGRPSLLLSGNRPGRSISPRPGSSRSAGMRRRGADRFVRTSGTGFARSGIRNTRGPGPPPGAETAQGMERRRALHDPLRILRTVGKRTFVGGRKEVDAPLVQEGVEIVEQIGGGIAVFGHEDMHAARTGDQRRRIKRQSPADQLFEVDGGTPLYVFAVQVAEALRAFGQPHRLLAGRLSHYFRIKSLSLRSW